MKKNTPFLGLLLLIAYGSGAQNVTATSSGEGNVGNMNISYTIGETFISTHQNGNSILTEGFHQSINPVTVVEENILFWTLKVFPNPTTSILQVHFKQVKFENLKISLCDITGRVIQTSRVIGQVWETDLSALGSGYYLITVIDEKTHKSNSFKIFKSN